MTDREVSIVVDDLVIANRILAQKGVLDAFGHISVRDPGDPGRYLMSRSLAPGLVTADDIVAFDLDSEPVQPQREALYAERYIHGEIYRSRADVDSVCHSHAADLIPFGVSSAALRPIAHMDAINGADAPVWDIREDFGDTDLLVTDAARGKSLAERLGDGRAALMRGHGAVIVGPAIRQTVFAAYYLTVNARLLQLALALDPDPTYLSPGEIAAAGEMLTEPLSQDRAWRGWASDVGYSGLL